MATVLGLNSLSNPFIFTAWLLEVISGCLKECFVQNVAQFSMKEWSLLLQMRLFNALTANVQSVARNSRLIQLTLT
jgi:hypothetical protein